MPLAASTGPLQRWLPDLVSDQLASGRRFRILNIVDDHSWECPGQVADLSNSGERLARFLDDLTGHRGLSECLVMDNGPGPTSRATFEWGQATSMALRFIKPGNPIQGADVESVQREVPK